MSSQIESALAALKPAYPPGGLRARVLAAAIASRRRARSGRVLRWAIAAFIATLAWARIHEDHTADRMARVAAAAAGVTVEEPQVGLLARAVLYPRVPMPLPQGYPSTRRHVRLLSIEFESRRPSAVQSLHVRVRPCPSVSVRAATTNPPFKRGKPHATA